MNAIVMEGFIDCIVKKANPTLFKRIFPYFIPKTKREGLMLGTGFLGGTGLGVALVRDKDNKRFTEKSRLAGQALNRGAREFVQGTFKGENVTGKEKNSSEVLKGKILGLSKDSASDSVFDSVVRGGAIGAGLGMASNVASRLPKALRKKLLVARLLQGGLIGGVAGAGGGMYEHSRKRLDQKPIRYDYHYHKYPEVKE
ncbi:MAG: hypothetical protein SCARUB_01674 [Candidatus Scalindua rubra]|uniref:Uncharacterized protein n=1 Tax=Candidatus Scalindua rubra TaxID=1872076 RepID=A0A1E3XC44_9BACT|nr:MAG: hypothetical protein SCARUB_01674 [Candidatus Scalindua rubra]